MNEEWIQIREDYEKALYALRCPRHLNGRKQWSRDRQTGRCYLWKAYQAVRESKTPDHLVFARILALMADEHRSFPSEYDRLHYYAKPAYEHYQLAAAEGQAATSQELEFIEWLYSDLTYIFQQRDEPYENHIKRISGHEKMGGFYFHDSKTIHFEHGGNSARITLQNGSLRATFRFEDVTSIDAHIWPQDDYIYDFYCYPRRDCPDERLIVDFEFYTIDCSAMECESVESV